MAYMKLTKGFRLENNKNNKRTCWSKTYTAWNMQEKYGICTSTRVWYNKI